MFVPSVIQAPVPAAIVGILAFVVSLNLGGLDEIKLDNAVKKLVSDLRYAQQLAVSTQSRHGLTIDSTQIYSVHDDNSGADTDIDDPTNLGVPFIVDFDTYQQGQLSGVRFTSTTPFCGGGVMEFDSLGAPTDTGGTLLGCTPSLVLIYLGDTRTITIEQNTGRLTY